MDFMYNLIEELCYKKGINVTTLCRDCAIPRSTLTDYKKGRVKSLSLDTVTKIADYFGVEVSYLCGLSMGKVSDEALKLALFGDDITVTDGMLNEVKRYALFIKEKSLK